jgi:hypothetical protein
MDTGLLMKLSVWFENGSRIDVLVSVVRERVEFERKHASLYRGR